MQKTPVQIKKPQPRISKIGTPAVTNRVTPVFGLHAIFAMSAVEK